MSLKDSEPPRFSIVSKIGQGGYGTVFKAIDHENGDVVALKQVQLFQANTLPISFYRELKCLQQCKHENIINFRDIARIDGVLYFVLDYCEFDLQSLLESSSKLTSLHKISYIKQILLAVKHLHDKGFIHRDIKPPNVLVTRDNKVKLTDFGLTRQIDAKCHGMSPKVVTLIYRAPELLLGETKYTKSIDIWSLGCLIYEILTGNQLFNPVHNSDASQMDAIFRICGSPDPKLHPNLELFHSNKIYDNILPDLLSSTLPPEMACFVDIIEKMLYFDPNERISIEEVLENPIFGIINGLELQPIALVESHMYLRETKQRIKQFQKKINFRPPQLLPTGLII